MVVIWAVTTSTLPVPRLPSISHKARRVYADRSFVLFCKCAAGSGVSLHHQYSIESFHPDNVRNGPSPLVFFQPLANFKRRQQRPFHLIPLRKNKACRLQERENLVIKVPAAYLLGAQLISIIGKAPPPLSFAFSLRLLESLISASFARNHQDLKLQTSEHLGLAQAQHGMLSQAYLLHDTGKALPIKSPVPSLRKQ